MGLVANRDIAEGEEITVNYNYGEGDGPAWYSEAEKGESLQSVQGTTKRLWPGLMNFFTALA